MITPEMTELGQRVEQEWNDENRGTVEQRAAVITRRGEWAEDMARLQRRKDAEAARVRDEEELPWPTTGTDRNDPEDDFPKGYHGEDIQ